MLTATYKNKVQLSAVSACSTERFDVEFNGVLIKLFLFCCCCFLRYPLISPLVVTLEWMLIGRTSGVS